MARASRCASLGFTAQSLDTEPAAGWAARLRLQFRAGAQRTELRERERSGPLSVQRPFYPEGAVCHVYLLHPPGGAVGGDRIDTLVGVDSRAHTLLTTPGAGKFYRSAGADVQVSHELAAAPGGRLEWLPQENIYFPGARVRSQTRIELAGDARVVAWELQCLGLPANGATFDSGKLTARLEVWREGEPLLLECLRVAADTRTHAAGLRGRSVVATLIASGADASLCHTLRAALASVEGADAAVTLIDDVLVVRYLGASSSQAKAVFVQLWRHLRPRLLGRGACPPRIWAT